VIGEITKIGETVVGGDEGSLLEALVEDIAPLERRAKDKPLLVHLQLQSNPPHLNLTPHELDQGRAAEYAWLGNVRGNRPQIRVTTSTLAYLLGQTPAALVSDARTPPDVKALLDRAFPDLFYVDSTLRGSKRRYAYLLNAEPLGLVTPEEWQEILAQAPKTRAQKLADLLRTRFDLPKDGALYTLVIDGEAVAKLPSYRRFLVRDLVEEAYEGAEEGVCHLCGERAPVSANFTRFKLLKFYINDKLSFAYGLAPENWRKNYAVCQRCYINLLAGERYLEKTFSTRVLRAGTLLIPHLGPEPQNEAELRELGELLTRATTGLDRIENVPALLRKLNDHTALPQLTMLFIERSQSAVKVQESVPEVEPSRIASLLTAIGETNDLARQLFGPPPGDYWLPGLYLLLSLLPLRQQRGNPELGPALRAFRQILLQEPMERRSWVRGFLEILRFAYRQNPGLYTTRNCSKPKQCPELHHLIPQMAAFLAFLERAGMIKEVKAVSVVAKTYSEAVEKLGLDGPRAALFLLGMLLARVASEQYKKGKSKPILEKVGYQGMPLAKVKRFTTELFEKLSEYRRLDANSEALFGEAMELLARHENRWPLSDEENAFYILLGYGLETRRILTAGQSGGDEE